MEFVEIEMYAVILRTHSYMEETGRHNSFDRFQYLQVLTERLTEEVLNHWEHDTGEQAERYWNLLQRIGDGQEDPVLQNTLDLCLAAALIPEFAAYLTYYTGASVTIQTAFALEGVTCPLYEEILDRLEKLERICRIEWGKIPLSLAAIEADNRLIAYLFTGQDGDKKASGGTQDLYGGTTFGGGIWFLQGEELHGMFAREELAVSCAEWMRSHIYPSGEELLNTMQSGVLLQIAGSGGRRFLAKHIARLVEKDMLLLPAEKCGGFFGEDKRNRLGELRRELFWHQGMLCLYGLDQAQLAEWKIDAEDFLETVVWPLLAAGISVILCTAAGLICCGEEAGRMRSVELTPLSRAEREQMFRGLALRYEAEADWKRASVRYRLSASEMARAFGQWQQGAGAQGAVETPKDFDGQFSRICCEMLGNREDRRYGEVCYPSERLSDLKVSEEIREVLGQICSSALEGHRIFEEWGLAQQYPYGRAVTVLLAGPPGTGKTMTAHVIANTLGIPLFQVDLSGIMDKYIGETEKHLEHIFAFAGKTNTVLFFDEADALFGRRGEVVEGKDRYANMEVSYILQRVEQFEGVVVLATNFYNNIDKAFLRRMKYVLKFQMPDVALRRSIWESCLPPGVPTGELDMDYLSEKFEFSGGMIKNVVLAACVMAVHEGKRVDMGHILRAVRAEHEKMEWPVSGNMWGAYAYLME